MASIYRPMLAALKELGKATHYASPPPLYSASAIRFVQPYFRLNLRLRVCEISFLYQQKFIGMRCRSTPTGVHQDSLCSDQGVHILFCHRSIFGDGEVKNSRNSCEGSGPQCGHFWWSGVGMSIPMSSRWIQPNETFARETCEFASKLKLHSNVFVPTDFLGGSLFRNVELLIHARDATVAEREVVLVWLDGLIAFFGIRPLIHVDANSIDALSMLPTDFPDAQFRFEPKATDWAHLAFMLLWFTRFCLLIFNNTDRDTRYGNLGSTASDIVGKSRLSDDSTTARAFFTWAGLRASGSVFLGPQAKNLIFWFTCKSRDFVFYNSYDGRRQFMLVLWIAWVSYSYCSYRVLRFRSEPSPHAYGFYWHRSLAWAFAHPCTTSAWYESRETRTSGSKLLTNSGRIFLWGFTMNLLVNRKIRNRETVGGSI